MLRTHITCGALVVVMLSVPSLAQAQRPAPDDAERWYALVTQLEPEALVSVRLKDGTRMKGTVVAADPAAFMLLPRTRIPVAARDLRYEDIASIERSRRGMNAGAKVLLGAGVCAAGLLLLLAAIITNSFRG